MKNRPMILSNDTWIIYEFFGFLQGSYLEIKYGQYETTNDPGMKIKATQPGNRLLTE